MNRFGTVLAALAILFASLLLGSNSHTFASTIQAVPCKAACLTATAVSKAAKPAAPTKTPIPTRTPTRTPVPTATRTPIATATNIPAPTATNTPVATATNTSVATPTDTPAATPTTVPVPTSTNTSIAPPTNTPVSPATDTPTGASGAALAAGTLFAQDTFAGRTTSGGWGISSDGSTWTLQAGSAAILSVAGGEAHITGTGASPTENLTIGTSPALDVDAVVRYSTGSFANDNGRLLLRFSDASDYYAAGFASPSGSELNIYKTSGGATSRLCGVPFAATDNAFYWERARVETSSGIATISVRAWQDGTAEPSSWQLTCTDATPLPAGLVGINAWDGGVVWSVDHFSAGSLSAPIPTLTSTPAPSPSPTADPVSTPTDTPVPTSTGMPAPTATSTAVLTATSTAVPTATATQSPGGTVASGTLFAQDTFAGRTQAGGWGISSDGSAWTLQSGSAPILSVSGNEASISGSGSSPTENLTLGTGTASNVEAVVRYSTGGFVDDNGRLLLNYSDAADYYAAGFASPSGSELDVYRTAGGTTSRLCGTPFAATNNAFYWERVRVQTSGGSATISVRAWQDGTTEPGSWQLTCTDAAPLPAGLVGINAWDGGVGWSMDHFSAGYLGTPPTPTPSPLVTPTATPASTATPTSTAITIAAAGDISCAPGSQVTSTSCQQQATSNLLVQGGYSAILALGDDQYDSGALSEFMGSYDPTWGRLKSITHPVPGNHEYNTSGATGYYSYYGSAAGASSKGYYSYDLSGWHFIALNSNCGAIGGCGAGSAEESWLRSDLAAHSNRCTIAYYHHPRWSSGEEGDQASMAPIWTDLANAHVDIVLSGHDHDYERFGPQDANGNASASGTREFVVGTGGENHAFFYQVQPNSQVRNDQTFGILSMKLYQSSYTWSFIPIAGQSFTDSGSGSCN